MTSKFVEIANGDCYKVAYAMTNKHGVHRGVAVFEVDYTTVRVKVQDSFKAEFTDLKCSVDAESIVDALKLLKTPSQIKEYQTNNLL